MRGRGRRSRKNMYKRNNTDGEYFKFMRLILHHIWRNTTNT